MDIIPIYYNLVCLAVLNYALWLSEKRRCCDAKNSSKNFFSRDWLDMLPKRCYQSIASLDRKVSAFWHPKLIDSSLNEITRERDSGKLHEERFAPHLMIPILNASC